MNIGKAIKDLRIKKQMTILEFAKTCGIDHTRFLQIENNDAKPTKIQMEKICKALDMSEVVLCFYAIEAKDVKAAKKDLFKAVKPAIDGIIEALFE